MTIRPRVGAPQQPDVPFRYIGGDPALDLVNTVAWTAVGPVNERLTDYGRVVEFAEGAGIIGPESGDRLRRLAAREPYAAARALDRVLIFRDALQQVIASTAADSSEPALENAKALAALNDELRAALGHLQLSRAGREVTLGWTGLGDSVESPLWPLAWSAAQLLASEEQSRVRVCAAADCGWVYVDRSRNRLRRWCEMETCGNRAKAARRYASARRRPR